MGVTMRQIVEEIGGGVRPTPAAAAAASSDCQGAVPRTARCGGHHAACRPKGRPGSPRRFKAVQIGGPSGGCVPAELADTPVDYDALAHVGAIMGSGGLVVLDDADCMVDIARYFLRFTQDQSCGKCTLCRVGTRRMLDILDRICDGHGKPGDLDELGRLAETVSAGASAGWADRAEPGPLHAALLPPRIRSASGRPLSGGPVQVADPLPRDRRLHRLHALRPAMPRRRHRPDPVRQT